MNQKAVIIRSTEALFEPRYRSARDLLLELGFEVDEITWSRSKEKFEEPDNPRNSYIFRERAPYGGGMSNYESHIRFARFAKSVIGKLNPDVIYCCDFDALFLTLLYKKRNVVIFDQFDPISARFNFSSAISSLMNFVEALLGLQSHIRITANKQRIPLVFREKYVYRPNFFPLEKNVKFPVESKIRIESERTLFYGGTLGRDRGLEFVAATISEVPNWKLQIFGFGPERDNLKRFECNRVEINDGVSHETLIKFATNASAILALYDPKKANNRMTASNKLFEACQLGVPVITNKGTYLGEIVEKCQLGFVVEFSDKQSLFEALESVANMKHPDVNAMRKNMANYLEYESNLQRKAIECIKSKLRDYVTKLS